MKTGTYFYSSDIPKRNILQKHFMPAVMEDRLKFENYYIHPVTEREFWESKSDEVKEKYIKYGEEYLDYVWRSLPIMDYYNYFQPGNVIPSIHEKLTFEKRTALVSLAMAECFENKGRFIESIINGIFSICEETTWAVTAHFHACGEKPNIFVEGTEPIPDYHGTQIVDLRIAENVVMLSCVLKIFEPVFDKMSPNIKKRITDEIEKRFVKPYLERDNLWWLGFETDIGIWNINNWTTVMMDAAVFYALSVCEDEAVRKKVLLRALKSLDIYIDFQPDDGFCNEGISYWFGAHARLIITIVMLDYAAGGTMEIFKDAKIKNMLEFILNMRVSDSDYAAFSDGHPMLYIENIPTLFFFGKYTGDNRFCDLASTVAKQKGIQNLVTGNVRHSIVVEILKSSYYDAIKSHTIKADGSDNSIKWYNIGQVLNCRFEDGFSFFAKGGHNNESHNHNDIGSFVLYCDNSPVVIDVGVGTYTKYTFDPVERWKIFTMRGSYHNIPVINGAEQLNGRQYYAEEVVCNTTESTAKLSMDLTKAYPEEAKIGSYQRSFSVSSECVEVCDCFSSDKAVSAQLMLITPCDVTIDSDTVDFGGCKLKVTGHDSISCEKIDFDDNAITEAWGETLNRIIISADDAKQVMMRFERQNSI